MRTGGREAPAPPVVPVRRLLPTGGRRLPVAVADGRRAACAPPDVPAGTGDDGDADDPAPCEGAAAGALICFPGFRNALDDLEMQRLRVLAERTGRLVVTVETPGYGSRPAPMRPQQVAALVRGDFGPIAEEMLDAVAHAVHGVFGTVLAAGQTTLLGFSMGASSAAAAARVWRVRQARGGLPDGLRVVLVEPVATAATWVSSLALADYADYRHLADDLADSRRLGWPVPPDLRRRRPERTRVHYRLGDLAAFGIGMSHGRIPRDLIQAARILPMQVDLVRGQHSHLVTADRIRALRAALVANGCRVTVLEIPNRHHAVWHDLVGVVGIVDRLGLAGPAPAD